MHNDIIDQLLDIADEIVNGEIPEYQENEIFIAGAFDLLLIKKRGAEAFKLLSYLIKIYHEIKISKHKLEGYFYLLDELARRSDTTEMPVGMSKIIDENPLLGSNLRKWYRLRD